MSLHLRDTGASGLRLPRTCGDEPSAPTPRESLSEVCPAPAGMSPGRAWPERKGKSLPRTCGDEPTAKVVLLAAM